MRRTLRVNNFRLVQYWLLIFKMLQDTGNYGLSPKFNEANFKFFYSMLKIKLMVKNWSVQILRELVADGDVMSRNLKCIIQKIHHTVTRNVAQSYHRRHQGGFGGCERPPLWDRVPFFDKSSITILGLKSAANCSKSKSRVTVGHGT